MTDRMAIVGDPTDLHVRGVLTHLGPDADPLVFDAPRLRDAGFSFDGHHLRVGTEAVALDGVRGWLRRYAPTMWAAGAVAGSLEAVTTRAFLGLVGSITRTGQVGWLTPLEAMLRAEDRMLQLQVARETGARTPYTIITSDFTEAIDTVGPTFVAKPLAGGYYTADDGPYAVYATAMSESDRGRVDFGAAPFMAQEKIEAEHHLRVVTVQHRAWIATLDAAGRPLDWRRQERAHREWTFDVNDDYVAARQSALKLADSLGIGYSSQDWICDGGDPVFLDLNPGGQWMFLPQPIASEVCAAIADFLVGRD